MRNKKEIDQQTTSPRTTSHRERDNYIAPPKPQRTTFAIEKLHIYAKGFVHSVIKEKKHTKRDPITKICRLLEGKSFDIPSYEDINLNKS